MLACFARDNDSAILHTGTNANKDAVLQMLGRFNEDLSALQRMIRRGDGQGLEDFFARTREIRRSIVEQGQDTAAADFGRRGQGR